MVKGKRLTDLREQEQGEILNFSDDVIASRFMAMGILPGSQTCMIKKAPFKGGVYLKVDNNRIALRCSEAESIFVKA